MKKAILFFALAITGTSFAQDCSELFISEYVEGTGNNKAIEIFNPTGSAISLTGYRIERFSNGQSTSSSGGVLNLSGTIAAHSTFVIANGQTTTSPSSPACDPALQAMADQLDGVYPAPTYMNGNDAIVLFKNTDTLDIFGKMGDASMTSAYGWSDEFPYDGSAGAVWTENHTLVRKASVLHGVTENPDPFIVTAQYDSLPEDTWTGLGSHTCDCPLGLEENTTVSFTVFPNPAAAGIVNMSASENIEVIEVLNALGQIVITERPSVASKHQSIDASALKNGIYLVRLSYGNSTFSQTSLVIR